MKLVALGLIATFAVFAWFRGNTSDVAAKHLFGCLLVGLVTLAVIPLTSHCSVSDLLFLAEPWHDCLGMVPGYGLATYGVIGLIKRVATND